MFGLAVSLVMASSPSWRSILVDPVLVRLARTFIAEAEKSGVELEWARDMAATLRMCVDLEEDRAETTVEDVLYAIKPKGRETPADRLRASRVLKAFAEVTGAGVFVVGRHGGLTRIVWNCRSAAAFAHAVLDGDAPNTRTSLAGSDYELVFGRIRVIAPANLTDAERRKLGDIALILAREYD